MQPAKITSIRYSVGRPRRKPKLGDRRMTKKYGLQIRVVETTSSGSWIKGSSGYYFAWSKPNQLLGTRFEHLLTAEERRDIVFRAPA